MNVAKYRHIIWDWNGTLLDDAWLAVEIINLMLGRRNLPPIRFEDYLERFDFPVIKYYRQVGFDLEAEPFPVIAMEFIEEYERRRFECKLREDAPRVLQHAADLGVSQSLLSATQSDSLREFVRHYGVERYFVKIIGLDDHYARGKTENGRRWVREGGWAPGEALLIGDTLHDHEVAEAIGADCVLITQGHHPRRRLESCGVELFDSLSAIFFNSENGKRTI